MPKELEEKLDDCFQRHFGSVQGEWKHLIEKYHNEVKSLVSDNHNQAEEN